VGAQLEAAGTASQLLPGVADAIADALRVPYVAIEIDEAGGALARTEHGTPVQDVTLFPLVHQGRTLGRFVVGHRTGQPSFSAAERDLMENIARQAAVAAANVVLTQELLRSRDRVINAAEDERRRLRRDLHDGLGPTLTAAASRIDACRNLLRRDPERADDLLRDVRVDLTSSLDDLRRLVYALRPPALDQLGLVGALREHVRRCPLPVILEAPSSLPDLPPAVEVAAYRIVTEAVTNVTRHANASLCTVSVSCDNRLRIEVRDDGAQNAPWTPGVGLSSINERTSELGGACTAGPADDGGGRLLVELPLTAVDVSVP
jgi:signal transduction histidine kinase